MKRKAEALDLDAEEGGEETRRYAFVPEKEYKRFFNPERDESVDQRYPLVKQGEKQARAVDEDALGEWFDNDEELDGVNRLKVATLWAQETTRLKRRRKTFLSFDLDTEDDEGDGASGTVNDFTNVASSSTCLVLFWLASPLLSTVSLVIFCV